MDTVQYEIVATTDIRIEDAPVNIVQIELYCDLEDTPWCVHPDQLDSMLADVQRSHKQAEEQVNMEERLVSDVRKMAGYLRCWWGLQT